MISKIQWILPCLELSAKDFKVWKMSTCNVEKSIKKFLDPNPEADDFKNELVLPCPKMQLW